MLSTCATIELRPQPFVVGFQSEYNFRMEIHYNLLQGEILEWEILAKALLIYLFIF